MMSLSLAPPSALMPPPALMSSTASCAPFSMRSPWRAHGPDIGAINPTLTSLICANDCSANEPAATLANAIARTVPLVVIAFSLAFVLAESAPFAGHAALSSKRQILFASPASVRSTWTAADWLRPLDTVAGVHPNANLNVQARTKYDNDGMGGNDMRKSDTNSELLTRRTVIKGLAARR